MTLEERIQGLRLRALYRAAELGNTSQVCRELGISRSLFYRWKKKLSQYGPEGLHPRRRGCRRGRPPKIEAHEEQAVLGMAFYIGNLKGVGKLWQVTACDAACSFAFAQVIPSVEAIHCAAVQRRARFLAISAPSSGAPDSIVSDGCIQERSGLDGCTAPATPPPSGFCYSAAALICDVLDGINEYARSFRNGDKPWCR